MKIWANAEAIAETGGLDAHMARLLSRLAGSEDPLLALATRLACRATSRGDICVSLAEAAGQPLAVLGEGEHGLAPPVAVWCEALRQHRVVGRPGEYAPLILDAAGRLYLYRYWAYQRELSSDLLARIADDPADVNPRRLRDGLDRLFPPAAEGGVDRQRLAAAVAALKRFCVISGGPGTGKTTTVVRILALLLEQARGPLRIALAAPTGKAAARMQEAIRASLETLRLDVHIRDAIPIEAATIHRLLGFRPGSVDFRHDRDNLLPVDVLVVDEASMVDLALMAKLVRAVPKQARLILLGDRDQLASVEAGAVLGDICGDSPRFSPAFRQRLAEVTGHDPADAVSVPPAVGSGEESGPPIRDAIPVEAATIHRLLGFRTGSVDFRHDWDHPLPVDVLVVDEASMVDLALMAKLVRAVPKQARLILLGDKDQLASVEAGAVLGDICGDSPRFSPAFRQRLVEVTGQDPADAVRVASGDGSGEESGPPIRDAIVQLTRSYRFGQESGIGRLAHLVNQGDSRSALALLERAELRDVVWRPLESPRDLASRLAEVAERFGAALATETPGAALAALERFRVLSAHRTGPYGVEALNQFIASGLESRRTTRPRSPWYPGRPVLVTANDYNLRLFNGDLGITLADPEADGRLGVFFRTAEGGVRRLAPARLPEHETAYATTVHKSQGSEADEILLILPDQLTPVMTRELVYTGLTRARSRVEIWGSAEVFTAAVSRRLTRSSGLRDALWGAG